MKKIKYIVLFNTLCSILIGCQQQEKLDNAKTSLIEYSKSSNHSELLNSTFEREDIEKSEPLVKILDFSYAVPLIKSSEIKVIKHENQRTSDTILTIEKQTIVDGKTAITPYEYQKILGKGMDVDWSKTTQGKEYYNKQTVMDFKEAGVSHVRIRVKDKADDELFKYLDSQIDDCLEYGLIPIIAYQADEFKNEPTQKNINQVVKWWGKVAQRYKDKSHLLSFDLLIEATDALNKQPEKLNEIYEQLVTEIRKTNPTRIIMMSPRLRSDATYLSELKVPTNHNNYMMAEWHFYAAGPSKTNEKKLWTSGTKEEQDRITEKINLALSWQEDTGIPTWVGAWMPGNYNDGNDYTIEEQVSFATFMTQSLSKSNIPFAVNSDTKFYSRRTNQWIEDMKPVFRAIYE